MGSGSGDPAFALLFEFVSIGWVISWCAYMAGWMSSGKRLTSVVKIE